MVHILEQTIASIPKITLFLFSKGLLESHVTSSVYNEAIPKMSGVTITSKYEDLMFTKRNHSWVLSTMLFQCVQIEFDFLPGDLIAIFPCLNIKTFYGV